MASRWSLTALDRLPWTVPGSLAHSASSDARRMVMSVMASLGSVTTGLRSVMFLKWHKSHSKGIPMMWSPFLPLLYLMRSFVSRSRSLSSPSGSPASSSTPWRRGNGSSELSS